MNTKKIIYILRVFLKSIDRLIESRERSIIERSRPPPALRSAPARSPAEQNRNNSLAWNGTVHSDFLIHSRVLCPLSRRWSVISVHDEYFITD